MNTTADTIRNATREQLGEMYEGSIGYNPLTDHGYDGINPTDDEMRTVLIDYLAEVRAESVAPSITLPDLEALRADPAPVYHKYPDNYQAQPAHLYLDEDGEVSVDWGDANSVTMDVAEGRTLRFRIPSQVTGKALVAMLEDERILRLLERIHVGHTVEWDGSNHRGRLTDDAREAADKLDAWLDQNYWDDGDMAVIWTVEDWMQSSVSAMTLAGEPCIWPDAQQFAVTRYGGDIFVVRAKSTDEELRELASGIRSSAETEGALLSDSASDFVDGLRDTCRENTPEE